MIRVSLRSGLIAAVVTLFTAGSAAAEEVVVDFESAVPLLAEQKANRVAQSGLRMALRSRWPLTRNKPKGRAC
jgi:hypothetical protein